MLITFISYYQFIIRENQFQFDKSIHTAMFVYRNVQLGYQIFLNHKKLDISGISSSGIPPMTGAIPDAMNEPRWTALAPYR